MKRASYVANANRDEDTETRPLSHTEDSADKQMAPVSLCEANQAFRVAPLPSHPLPLSFLSLLSSRAISSPSAHIHFPSCNSPNSFLRHLPPPPPLTLDCIKKNTHSYFTITFTKTYICILCLVSSHVIH